MVTILATLGGIGVVLLALFKGINMLGGDDTVWVHEDKYKIAVGNRVVNQNGRTGIVKLAGPYGDDPFQVMTDDGEHHSFIWFDGKDRYSGTVWEKV